MRRGAWRAAAALVAMLLVLSGCAAQTAEPAGEVEARLPETGEAGMEDAMRLWIGETEVPVTWEENESVAALRGLCPLTVEMSMYGGFEQVGAIGQAIPRDDAQTETACGDIVLYAGDKIVIFYGANAWAYTRLGHIDLGQDEVRGLLGGGAVTIALEN